MELELTRLRLKFHRMENIPEKEKKYIYAWHTLSLREDLYQIKESGFPMSN